MSNLDKTEKKLKYKHRAVYVFVVLLIINLTWVIFVKPPDSLKHFLWSITVPVGFGVFYFIAKNLKRYYSRKKSLKNKFLDSVAFTPFAYIAFISALLILFSIGGYFVDVATSNKVSKAVGKKRVTIVVGENPDTKSDSFESDAQNLIFFINVSMAQYALLPLSTEHSGMYKNFTKENIIHKKWAPTRRMMIISILLAAIMQLGSVIVAEKIIYKMVRKKKKKTPNRRNKILASPI